VVGERGFEPPTPWSRTRGRGANSVAIQPFGWRFDRLSLARSCQSWRNVNPRIATLARVSRIWSRRDSGVALGDLLTADISIRLPVMKFVMNGRTISLGRSMSSCVAANVFILRDMFSKSAAISLTLMSRRVESRDCYRNAEFEPKFPSLRSAYA
jgi:hypothetical protein